MRGRMKVYSGHTDYWDGMSISFKEHRDDGEIIHVMCSAVGADGGPAAIGSVPCPVTWEPVLIHG